MGKKMKMKEVTISELSVGDKVMWNDSPAAVIHLDALSDVKIRVVVSGGCIGVNSWVFPNDSIIYLCVERPNHDVCRDSDCDCIFDGVR